MSSSCSPDKVVCEQCRLTEHDYVYGIDLGSAMQPLLTHRLHKLEEVRSELDMLDQEILDEFRDSIRKGDPSSMTAAFLMSFQTRPSASALQARYMSKWTPHELAELRQYATDDPWRLPVSVLSQMWISYEHEVAEAAGVTSGTITDPEPVQAPDAEETDDTFVGA